MSDKLIMNHTVLCAKGWYRHSKNLWQDYKRTIYCDGNYMPETRNEVAQLLYMFIMKHKELLKGFVHDESDIPQRIREYMDRIIWWDKDYKKETSPLALYDDAVILFCHGVLQCAEVKLFKKILAPSDKVLPLSKWENETNEDRDKRFAEYFDGKLPYDEDDKYSKDYIKDYYKTLDDCIKNGELIYQTINEYTLADRMPKEGERIRLGYDGQLICVTKSWLDLYKDFTDDVKRKYVYFIKEDEKMNEKQLHN